MKRFLPSFLATGIGSLPHEDLPSAIELINAKLPYIPHWPQLPKWGEEEGFINQYIEPLIRLGLMTYQEGLEPYFDLQSESWIENQTRFYELYLEASNGNDDALDYFAFPEKGGAGFYGFINDLRLRGTGEALCLKGQVSGPLTLALQLKDEAKKPAYYNPELRDLVVKTLAMMARWQTKKLQHFNLPVLMFVDDPGLCSFGLSTHITLKREDIIGDLNQIYREIHSVGGLTGTHSCAGMDWTLLTESKVNIISFDAYNYFSTIGVYGEDLQAFLLRGGVLAWGIVPTSEEVWSEDVLSLKEKLVGKIEYLVEKGISKDLLVKQALITPSCGTGTLSKEMAERIYTLTGELSAALR